MVVVVRHNYSLMFDECMHVPIEDPAHDSRDDGLVRQRVV